ncbi:hypothetical protein A6R68_21113 [Neotoma lepida]|uniref:Small ribosomal subunit protein eS6 n=1 Tax=Neotoma lepida TaxID=56216 RepID=A0A1A6HQE7_NEOLE|nr:hypothetical protein A6R68_21113 [Neotoma lepida]
MIQISGGNNKQDFPMKKSVLTYSRAYLLLNKGHSCYRPRRTRERKHVCSQMHCGCQSEYSQFGYLRERERERQTDRQTDRQTQKETEEEETMSTTMLSGSSQTKKVRSIGPKHPRLLHMSCNTNVDMLL